MRFSDIRAISRRQWLLALVGGVSVALLIITTVWTGRYAWAIYALNRGVGDTSL